MNLRHQIDLHFVKKKTAIDFKIPKIHTDLILYDLYTYAFKEITHSPNIASIEL